MTSRLRAALLTLFTREQQEVILVKKGVILATRPFNCFQLKGIESFKRLYHSGSEEDEFSELGLIVVKGAAATIPKLMTEKHETVKKCGAMRNDSPSVSVKSSKKLSLINLEAENVRAPMSLSSLFEDGPSATARNGLPSESIESSRKASNPSNCSTLPDFEPENVNVPNSNLEHRNACNIKSLRSITIKNVPSIINVFQLKEALSVFGKISYAIVREVPEALDCYDVEFESVESRNRAVSAGKITVENFSLQVCPLNVASVVTVRINNISPETADCIIHSTCMSYAPLEGLLRKKEDAVDALFTVQHESGTKRLMEKLNNTVIDDYRWSAALQTKVSDSVVTTNDDELNRWLQWYKVSNDIDDLQKHLKLKQMHAEDLECLHQAIVHLERLPLTTRRSL